MRKSWIHLSLGIAGAFVLFGQASAQETVNFWYNSLGDPVTNMPSVIDVVSGSSTTLSIYEKTAGAGALSGINVLFGYSTTTTTGSSAVRNDDLADVTSFTWAQADLTSGQLLAGTGGGGGPADGTTRPWGYFASSGDLSGTFAGTGDGVNFHVADVTLSILASPGTDIPINIWSFTGVDQYASAVLDSNFSDVYPASPYTGTLHVVAAPEPASMAALGIGVLALLRRRRR